MARIATLITPELVFLFVAVATAAVGGLCGAGPQGVPGTLAVLAGAERVRWLVRTLPEGPLRDTAAALLPAAA